MTTKLDSRAALTELIEKLDAPDMKQILAFAAGYEAGKLSQTPDLPAKENVQPSQDDCPT